MLFALVVLAAAPKTDAKLLGTWLAGGAPFVTFRADGTATMEEDRVKWSADGKTLKVVDADGETDTATYEVQGDSLTMTLGGLPLTLTRAGAGVQVKKQGALARRAEKQQEPDDDAAELARAQALIAAQQPAQQRGARPQAAGSDSLSRLLLSSAWCSFKYSQISGATSTSRVQFFANGTWSTGSSYEAVNSGPNGSVYNSSDSRGSGQWAVRGGQLWMADPGEPLQPVPGFAVTQNSNGYPIINADGKEYSTCQ
ncbi:MAG: hypothetical protein JNK82_14210 [Myxococcaceae bacterium]|nr:hypothetical protein [Myxococcaceae bacterium]